MANVWFWTTILLLVVLVVLHIFMPWFNATYEEVHNKRSLSSAVALPDTLVRQRSSFQEPLPNSPGRRKKQRSRRRKRA